MTAKKYDHSLLQTKTAARMVILIKDLMKHTKSFLDNPHSEIDKELREKIESNLSDARLLLKLHHSALNSLKNFNGKIHSEQLKYIFSGAHSERYKMP
tara:strand:+ start:22795 stop:23088 length:294 start_codon:yes stop_codon:yes gene_type:complete